MDTISADDFCSAIYCATTPAAAFTLNDAGGIALVARVMDAGFEEYYRVLFEAVVDLTWRGDGGQAYVPRPDDLFEFSAIEIVSAANRWRVWINPWSASVVEFRCTQIRINGARVVGSGKWFRDRLPAHHPKIPPFPQN
jgi:hypothetical protein